MITRLGKLVSHMETPEQRGRAIARLYGGAHGDRSALAEAVANEIKAAIADKLKACEDAMHALNTKGPSDSEGDQWLRGWNTGVAHALEAFLTAASSD